jgi:hypothetical protein
MIPHEYFEKVKKYFNGDDAKTWDWFKTTNPRLGMLSPLNAIKLGKEKRVMQIIDGGLSGYFP